MLKEKQKLKKPLVDFLRGEGVDIRTNTKARGHLGTFREGRIDINKKADEEEFVEIALHEYAHFIHKKLEPDMQKTGGTLETLFCTNDVEKIKEELEEVTKIVDEHSMFERIETKKAEIKRKIRKLETDLKLIVPEFQRSKPNKKFERFIKKSEAKYLLKYDRVKIVTPFLRREKIISVKTLRQDFLEMPEEFAIYIEIRSLMRRSKNLQARKNRLKKYYSKPSELFARLIQGMYQYREEIQITAPRAWERFNFLLEEGHFGNLKELIGFLGEKDI